MPDPTAVLVVDDDASTQSFLVAVVKRLGLNPSVAGDGRTALLKIAADEPAAILLDLITPEFDGFEVLRELRFTSPEILQRVIVIIAAGGHRVETCKELDEVWKFFRKPLDISKLGSSLLDCVGASASQTDRRSVYKTTPQP